MSKCSYDKAAAGEFFSVVRYVRVERKEPQCIHVRNVGGEAFSMSSNLLVNEYHSASQYEREEQKSRGEIANLFEHAGDSCFTVCFHKKPDAAQKANALRDLEDDPRQWSQAKRRKFVRETMLQGEERQLCGHLAAQTLDDLGRMKVFDLEKEELRLVDPRTIEWFIYKNVKYVAK